jgi:transposase-like protein
MKINKQAVHLEKSETIEEIPLACCDELVGVEFLEKRLWKGEPVCHHCQSKNVYAMRDSKTGERNKRFLWRCNDCKQQFTVRLGTVFEESRIPLRHWVYTFWRASTSKKGVSALEIKRQTQLSYKSALFLMHRIRFAMEQNPTVTGKMTGTVEVDETYVGGKAANMHAKRRKEVVKGRGGLASGKAAVLGIVQRDGGIHRRVVTDVCAATLKSAIREVVDNRARVITDECRCYDGLGKNFKGGHFTVNHSAHEYARGDVFTNTAESSFALIKRGLMGVYHAVSKKHLPRYLAEFDFRWNTRKLNDGDRTTLAIQSAMGKRLIMQP